MRRLVLLFILTAFAGCSGELHVSPPNAPKNLSATFRVDIFGGEYVNLQWEDTNWSDDIGFVVHRDGAEIAVVDPECIAWDDIVCTEFRMYTSYYDYNVSRGETYCYAVSAHYYGVVDASIFGDSDLSTETCITIPSEGSERLPKNGYSGRPGDLTNLGLIDTHGKFLLEPTWDFITPFSDGRIFIGKGGRGWIIDEENHIVPDLSKLNL